MKFSKKRKLKIRKQNQRRIKIHCKNLVGCCIDDEAYVIVIDQIKIENDIYLLTEDNDEKYAIYKIVRIGQYSKIGNKKILQKKEKLLKRNAWKYQSQITLETDGTISGVQNNS